jgi:phage shock protein A
MKLLKRVNMVVTAQLHEAVECFEKPERMLKQAIREMEATLQTATESTARAIAGEKQVERRLAESRARGDAWQARAQQAAKSGDDAAARMALARRFELETRTGGLAAQLARWAESNSRLRLQLDTLRCRLAEAKGQMAVLVARQRSAEALRQFSKAQGIANVDLESFRYFDELAVRVTEAEAEAEALSELSDREPQVAILNHDIEHELQLLKAAGELPRG